MTLARSCSGQRTRIDAVIAVSILFGLHYYHDQIMFSNLVLPLIVEDRRPMSATACPLVTSGGRIRVLCV